MENETLETQDTNAEQGSEDTGFLEGLGIEAPEGSEAQGAERDTNAEPSHDPEEGAAAGQTSEAAGKEPEGDKAEEDDQPKGETEEKPGEAFLEVTFLGEKKTISREEATALAQKGMNYDHLDGQLKELGAERARMEAELSVTRADQTILPLLRAYAKAAGGDLNTLTAQMMQAVKRAGVPVEPPRTGNYVQEKAVSDWKAFLKAYPDIRDPKTELPQEVWARINQGVTPVNAMIEHRQADLLRQIAERDAKIKEYEEREKARELNEKNKKKAGGSLASTAGSGNEDGFLAGLFG